MLPSLMTVLFQKVPSVGGGVRCERQLCAGHDDAHVFEAHLLCSDVQGMAKTIEAGERSQARMSGGGEWESNPPGDAWRHPPGLKPGRPTRDASPPVFVKALWM